MCVNKTMFGVYTLASYLCGLQAPRQLCFCLNAGIMLFGLQALHDTTLFGFVCARASYVLVSNVFVSSLHATFTLNVLSIFGEVRVPLGNLPSQKF